MAGHAPLKNGFMEVEKYHNTTYDMARILFVSTAKALGRLPGRTDLPLLLDCVISRIFS